MRQVASIEEALDDIRRGKMVILVDDEDRENEGDLYFAAEKATPDLVNFMTKHGRGLICLPMVPDRIDKLDLEMMTKRNESRFGTAFTVSIEAREGVSTGISAQDRCQTILTAVREDCRPEDLVSPGHVFPLRAAKGGVMVRAGQTEGAVDLSRLAGLKAAGVICEILKDDGTMARLPDLLEFGDKHGIKVVTIADLIKFRMEKESFVSVVARANLPTAFGDFDIVVYQNEIDGSEHVILRHGEILPDRPTLVRVHSECLTGDVFGSMKCDCGSQLHAAMQVIVEEGAGVVLYLRQEGRGIGLTNKIKAYALQDQGMDTVEANTTLGFKPDLRNYGVGAQILNHVGLRKIRIMTNNPRKIIGISGFGLEIVDRVAMEINPNDSNLHYLKTKREKLGHLLNKV